jgi:CDP-4-dehydro-6-deoxyglucose reductase
LQIRLRATNRVFTADASQSVLAAALQAGVQLPYSCTGGKCGACRARLLSGQIRYPRYVDKQPPGLTAAERDAGDVLLCQAVALSDLEIETPEVRRPLAPAVKQLPCRVEYVGDLSPELRTLHLRLPQAEVFEFQAGQYVVLLLSDGPRYVTPVVSPPLGGEPLEVQIELAPGGAPTSALQQLRERSLLRMEGPYIDVASATVGRPIADLSDT